MIVAAALALALADSPEAALKDFVAAWNRRDMAGAARRVDGADPKRPNPILKEAMASKEFPILVVSNIRREPNGLLVDVGVRGLDVPLEVGQDERIDTIPSPEGWKLSFPAHPVPSAYLGSLVRLFQEPKAAPPSADGKVVAMSNLKQIALGTIMLAGDNDDVYKLAPSTAVERITPYIKNQEVFKDPGTGRSDVYVYNAHLTNTPVAYVQSPAETVLWSLGGEGKLLFPYDGKTIIAFADGHVKTVSLADATRLVWTPNR